MTLVQLPNSILVCIDSRVPEKLVANGLYANAVSGLKLYNHVKRQPKIPSGRLDFLLHGNGTAPCYLEEE
ncbi:MAG: DNA/RNA nuclease SfsA [Peptococcaceae bacterium]|nr:DNA/RNA nuclease SfsA [Peptococcaceae bacterium]